MKKILTIILCMCLLFSMTAVNVLASIDGGTNIMPMAENYSTANVYLGIDNWSLTKNSSILSLEKTANVEKGSKYRVKADITAYAGIERESITKYSNVVSY